MPDERTRALIWAGELLQEMQRSGELPQRWQTDVARVLRHYPDIGDIGAIALHAAGASRPMLDPAAVLEHRTQAAAVGGGPGQPGATASHDAVPASGAAAPERSG
jgi:hypothetical protein